MPLRVSVVVGATSMMLAPEPINMDRFVAKLAFVASVPPLNDTAPPLPKLASADTTAVTPPVKPVPPLYELVPFSTTVPPPVPAVVKFRNPPPVILPFAVKVEPLNASRVALAPVIAMLRVLAKLESSRSVPVFTKLMPVFAEPRLASLKTSR
ncbi:hypothetical protein DP49_5696 [Burkholderia pseudomallei]|nr:hypothetical protein DP49_5696 [Burkholderia pseudomallei]